MTPKAILAHYSAVMQLIRYLTGDQTGGVFGATVEMITKVTSAKGVMAYELKGNELVLVADAGLPRKAKAWLARLPIDDQPWFIAQRVAIGNRGEVASQLAESRMGHSIQPALEAEGWKGLAGSPIRVGAEVYGVLVLATGGTTFDKQTLRFLDAICGVLGLASAREAVLHKTRDDALHASQTAELATLGLLTAGVVKNLQGPLADIAAEVARIEDADVAASLRKSVERARKITSRFDSMAREGETDSVELGECVRDTVGLLRSGVEERGVELSVDYSDAPMYVEGRYGSLQLLVVQLVLYAAEECAAAEAEQPRVHVTVRGEAGQCLLDVEMTGSQGRSGARIFDGMLRGKSSGAAAGIELARQTVSAHHGEVHIRNSELGGAMVTIALPETLPLSPPSENEPAVEPAPAAAAAPEMQTPTDEPLGLDETPSRVPPSERSPLKLDIDDDSAPDLGDELMLEMESNPAPATPIPDPTPTPTPARTSKPPSSGRFKMQKRAIVWIDDDMQFLRAMARSITTHETLLVGSVDEAVELFEDLDVLPELILCDVTLPDGLGTDLHQNVTQDLADRFVFVTGGVIGSEPAQYLKSCGRPTLIKPISVEEVHQLLQNVPTNPPPPPDEEPVAAVADAPELEVSSPSLSPAEDDDLFGDLEW